MQNRRAFLLGMVCLLCCLSGCSKEEIIIVTGNEAPNISNIPTIKIEHYVNRIFIDLIGREPLDVELDREVEILKRDGLTPEARIGLIKKIQLDDSFIEIDTSYTRAYHRQLYNLAKVRCLEGRSDEDILGFAGDDPAADARLQAVIDARLELESGEITIEEVFARMIHNAVYDEINMNTFNFVNATFDNLLWRFPTNAEFSTGFNMVEFHQPQTFFGETGAGKDDYVRIITHTREMFEGLIIWVYRQLLARNPTTAETEALLNDFYEHRDLKKIQQHVMATDEYASF